MPGHEVLTGLPRSRNTPQGGNGGERSPWAPWGPNPLLGGGLSLSLCARNIMYISVAFRSLTYFHPMSGQMSDHNSACTPLGQDIQQPKSNLPPHPSREITSWGIIMGCRVHRGPVTQPFAITDPVQLFGCAQICADAQPDSISIGVASLQSRVLANVSV